jgi:hypothetical protein
MMKILKALQIIRTFNIILCIKFAFRNFLFANFI